MVTSSVDLLKGIDFEKEILQLANQWILTMFHTTRNQLFFLQRRSNRQFPRLLRLSSTDEAFENSLNMLDRMSNRTYDTLYIVLVRKGQTEGDDILKNEVSNNFIISG